MPPFGTTWDRTALRRDRAEKYTPAGRASVGTWYGAPGKASLAVSAFHATFCVDADETALRAAKGTARQVFSSGCGTRSQKTVSGFHATF